MRLSVNEEDTEAGAFRDVVQRLSAWAEGQNLVEQAREGFAAWFQTEAGVIDGWTVAEVRPQFHAHSLCFTSTLPSYPYVTTSLDLYAPDGTEIGTYRLITTLDGETDDDYFVIEVSKAENGRRRKPGARVV